MGAATATVGARREGNWPRQYSSLETIFETFDGATTNQLRKLLSNISRGTKRRRHRALLCSSNVSTMHTGDFQATNTLLQYTSVYSENMVGPSPLTLQGKTTHLSFTHNTPACSIPSHPVRSRNRVRRLRGQPLRPVAILVRISGVQL